MADALSQGADVVMTDGGPQSNHARLTAAAARKAGIDRCILFLGGPRFDRFEGNLLLDVILGAEIRFMEDANVRRMEAAMQVEADALRRQNATPYVIPIGGSAPIGCLGYVRAMRELAGQLEPEDKNALVFVAVGSGGTLAGCALGLRLFLPEAEPDRNQRVAQIQAAPRRRGRDCEPRLSADRRRRGNRPREAQRQRQILRRPLWGALKRRATKRCCSRPEPRV